MKKGGKGDNMVPRKKRLSAWTLASFCVKADLVVILIESGYQQIFIKIYKF